MAALCETPGKKIRSKGEGRGLAVGKGKGPVGRMAYIKKLKKNILEEQALKTGGVLST